MTVTELAHFHTQTGDYPRELQQLASLAIKAQDKWCAENLSKTTGYMSDGTVARGLGNPGALLLTAHWDSPEQHKQWIDSDVNKDIMPRLGEFLDMSKLLFYHVDDVAPFTCRPSPESHAFVPNTVIVSRYFVPKARKRAFGAAMKELMSREGQDGKSIATCAWRIEKGEAMERDGIEELNVVVAGCGNNISDYSKITNASYFKTILGDFREETHLYQKML
ncbi:hypothetical protein LQW54_001838 [Pestalotiopsis sp. IQ-011]